MTTANLSGLSVNTIRTLSIDAIQKANSGHPGLPLGAAPMAYALWQKHLRHNPRNPLWPDRDRFVLSAGHGSMLLYSLLHLTGYDLSLDDLRNFRQWGSKTPGHPEAFLTPGVEATTGPLGQGAANAVGMAMAERFLAHRYNQPGFDLVNHYTYALVSDGDLMEGVSAEAASMAGHLKLGKLIYLYDANDVTLDGPASLCFTGEDLCARYEAYGWQVLRVEDGDTDVDAIDRAITEAKQDAVRPTLIFAHTTIGYGSPNKAGTAASHGSPLGEDEVALTKKALGWDPKVKFLVPGDVAAHMSAVERGAVLESEWHDRFEVYASENPELAAEWTRRLAGELPEGWDDVLPTFESSQAGSAESGFAMATRSAGGQVLNALAASVPWLFGGDADLGCSTKTVVKDGGDFEGEHGGGRNIHFGIREHAMGAAVNGMHYHGGMRGYCSTFFVFSDYMRPAVRLAALNHLPAIYVWTHDSILLGEDGPTHQPVEQLMSLRAMPNLSVMRPCDANETVEAWRYAMERTDGPTALVLSRQNLPILDRSEMGAAAGVRRGAYTVRDLGAAADGIGAIIVATGSEVALALAAQQALFDEDIASRVVSMPCWELFEAQDEAYRESVLPSAVSARVSVEAGVTFGWSRWVGRGVSVGVDRFGASAPASVLAEKYGLTAAAVADAVRGQL